MALTIGDRVCEAGLNALDTECDKIYVCSAQPTTYTEATSTYALGNKNWGAGNAFNAPTGASPGRKTQSVAITDGSVTASGTVSHWAAVDSANSRLLASDVVTGGAAVTSGQQFTLGSFAVQMAGTTASAYEGPGDKVSGAVGWWGLRAYNAAYATGSNPAIDVVKTSDGTGGGTINILSTGALDVATIAGFGYGVSVSKIYDQTASGLHLTQATLANMPTITLNGVGSLPIISFNGSQSLSHATGYSTTNQPGTISVVAIKTATGYASTLRSVADILFTNFDNDVGIYSGATINHVACADNTWHTLQGICDDGGGGSLIYVNGSSSSSPMGNSAFLTTAIQFGTGTGTLTGAMTEGGFWTSAFNSTQAGNMNTNQRAYWGI